MATKTLWKVGGIGGHGTAEIQDTDGQTALLLNGVPVGSAAAGTAIGALTPLADPNTATAPQIATLLNQVVAALQAS